jgi:hypothetical protein
MARAVSLARRRSVSTVRSDGAVLLDNGRILPPVPERDSEAARHRHWALLNAYWGDAGHPTPLCGGLPCVFCGT